MASVRKSTHLHVQHAVPPGFLKALNSPESSLASALLAAMALYFESSTPPELSFSETLRGFHDSCTPCRVFAHTQRCCSLLDVPVASTSYRTQFCFLYLSNRESRGPPGTLSSAQATYCWVCRVSNNPMKISLLRLFFQLHNSKEFSPCVFLAPARCPPGRALRNSSELPPSSELNRVPLFTLWTYSMPA
jgi:hypothetical protein